MYGEVSPSPAWYDPPEYGEECPNPACEDGRILLTDVDGDEVWAECKEDCHRPQDDVAAEHRLALAEFRHDLETGR